MKTIQEASATMDSIIIQRATASYMLTTAINIIPTVEMAKVVCDTMRPFLLSMLMNNGVRCQAEHMMEVPACSRHTDGLGATTTVMETAGGMVGDLSVAVMEVEFALVAEGLMNCR